MDSLNTKGGRFAAALLVFLPNSGKSERTDGKFCGSFIFFVVFLGKLRDTTVNGRNPSPRDVGGIKPGKEWDKLPFSTGFHAGFLNHQPYHQLLPSVLPVLQGARFGIKTRQLLGVGLQETT